MAKEPLNQHKNNIVNKARGVALLSLAKAPTTNIRILVTILIWVVVTVRYVIAVRLPSGLMSWEPSTEWLMALLGLSGVDTYQFIQKRKTNWQPPEEPVQESIITESSQGTIDEETSSTDMQEVREKIYKN